MRHSAPQYGFSLLEVLIALTIVSVALAAVVRVLGVASNNARGMQQSSLAMLAADNLKSPVRTLGRGGFPYGGIKICGARSAPPTVHKRSRFRPHGLVP